MKRIMKFSLAIILFGLSSTVSRAQELAVASNPDTNVKKFVSCKVNTSKEGCEIFFIKVEGDINSDKEKRVYFPVTIIKEYKINSSDNSIAEVDLSNEEVAKLAQEKIVGTDRDIEQLNYKNISFTLERPNSKPQEISRANVCDLPLDMPDGDYLINVSWEWITAAKSEEKKPDPKATNKKRASYNFVYSPKSDTAIKLKENPVVKKK